MNGYICTWSKKNKKIEVYANTTYEAQQIAAEKLGCKKSFEIDVWLAEKGGEPVIHSTSELG